MKTLKLTTAVIAAGLSSASIAWNDTPTVTWVGDSGAVAAPGCSFREQTNGVIERGSGLVSPSSWIATTPATIEVRVRGHSSLRMTSDNVLRTANGNPTEITATVDYTGADGGATRSGLNNEAGGTQFIRSNAMGVTGAVTASAELITFTVSGSALLTAGGLTGDEGAQAAMDLLANDTDYKINHTVTCSQ